MSSHINIYHNHWSKIEINYLLAKKKKKEETLKENRQNFNFHRSKYESVVRFQKAQQKSMSIACQNGREDKSNKS